ncbi:MAG: hypothetical protein IMW86_00885 [Hydrogenibacillus sp.]|nr:hypothetical protein [Hydrogenibacillus sp.]
MTHRRTKRMRMGLIARLIVADESTAGMSVANGARGSSWISRDLHLLRHVSDRLIDREAMIRQI